MGVNVLTLNKYKYIIIIIITTNSNYAIHIQTHRRCFLPWYKTQQKGLNIAKELGSAIPECTLMSKLSPSHLKDVFWMKLSEYQR